MAITFRLHRLDTGRHADRQIIDAHGRVTPYGQRLSDRLMDRTMDRLRRGNDAPATVLPFRKP